MIRQLNRKTVMPRQNNTIGTSTYERVKRDIIFGELAPGSKLKLDGLRDRYGASVSTLREILNQSRCRVEAAPIDADGLRPEAVSEATDVIFTTPSHQCPTSSTMPLTRRRALLDRARDIDAVIVEDDYEFEMSFLQPPLPALKSLDGDGRVIYVGSFSKSLFPGLRLGYLVGSPEFIREARALRRLMVR